MFMWHLNFVVHPKYYISRYLILRLDQSAIYTEKLPTLLRLVDKQRMDVNVVILRNQPGVYA